MMFFFGLVSLLQLSKYPFATSIPTSLLRSCSLCCGTAYALLPSSTGRSRDLSLSCRNRRSSSFWLIFLTEKQHTNKSGDVFLWFSFVITAFEIPVCNINSHFASPLVLIVLRHRLRPPFLVRWTQSGSAPAPLRESSFYATKKDTPYSVSFSWRRKRDSNSFQNAYLWG